MSNNKARFEKGGKQSRAEEVSIRMELNTVAKEILKDINERAIEEAGKMRNNNLTEEERQRVAEMSRKYVGRLLEKCKSKLVVRSLGRNMIKNNSEIEIKTKNNKKLNVQKAQNKQSKTKNTKSVDKENIATKIKTKKQPKLVKKRVTRKSKKKSRKGTPKSQKKVILTNKFIVDSLKTSNKSQTNQLKKTRKPFIKLKPKTKKKSFEGFLKKIVFSKKKTQEKIIEFVDMKSEIEKQIDKLTRTKQIGMRTPNQQSLVKNNILNSVFVEEKTNDPAKSKWTPNKHEPNAKMGEQRKREDTIDKIDHINGFLVQLSKEREERRTMKQEKERSFFKKLNKKRSKQQLKNKRQLELAEKVRQLEKEKKFQRGSIRNQSKRGPDFNVRYLQNERKIRKQAPHLPSMIKRVNFPKNMRRVQKPRASVQQKPEEPPRSSTIQNQNHGSRLSRSLIRGREKLPYIKKANMSMNRSRAKTKIKARDASSVKRREISYREMYLKRRKQDEPPKEEDLFSENGLSDIELDANEDWNRGQEGKNREEPPEEIEETINSQIADILQKMKRYKRKRGTIQFGFLKQRIVEHLMESSMDSGRDVKKQNAFLMRKKKSGKKQTRTSAKKTKNNRFRQFDSPRFL